MVAVLEAGDSREEGAEVSQGEVPGVFLVEVVGAADELTLIM